MSKGTKAEIDVWCSVNIVFAGHDHIYERTCPVYRQICQPSNKDGSQGGPMYVVIGNAGVRTTHLLLLLCSYAYAAALNHILAHAVLL